MHQTLHKIKNMGKCAKCDKRVGLNESFLIEFTAETSVWYLNKKHSNRFTFSNMLCAVCAQRELNNETANPNGCNVLRKRVTCNCCNEEIMTTNHKCPQIPLFT